MEPQNNQQRPDILNPQTPEQKKVFNKTLALGGGVLVLVIGFFFLGLYGTDIINYFKNQEKNSSGKQSGQASFVVTEDPKQSVEENSTTTVPSQAENPNEVWLDVDWNKDVVKIKCVDDGTDSDECYLAGKIKSGNFANHNLILELIPSMGTEFGYYAQNENTHAQLPGYPHDGQVAVYKFRGIDDAPSSIDFPGTGYKLDKAYRNQLFASVNIKVKLFDNKILGPVYLADNGCIVVELPDHTALAYNLDIPFVNMSNGELELTFQNGVKNLETYQYNAITGCGAMCYYLAKQDENVLKPQERLTAVGAVPSGEQFFALKDSNSIELKKLYEDKNTMAYFADGSYENFGKNKYTYEQYLALRPLLYWKDPLGRWIEFKNTKFILAAEMCKPVIYLYPEKETSLEVKVNPNGGFTHTNPPYGAGWKVVATPEGKITDTATGKTFDYLFWEGVGLNYPASQTGWVIEKKNLEQFFNETLPKLGLKGREEADFKEYWLQRLAEYPYYKINFLSQEQFNELAPLKISGAKPKTVVRVLMTAKGLSSPEVSVPQELVPVLKRQGFTVIEWGGVVLK